MRFPIPFIAFVLVLLLGACEFGGRPVSDPSELFERARTLFEEKSFSQAESLFVQSIAVAKQKGRPENLPQSHLYLGRIYFSQGKYRAALQQLQTARTESKKGNDFRTEARAQLYLGDVDYELGDYEGAIGAYNASRSLSSAFNDRKAKAEVEGRLGHVLASIGQLDDALKTYESALNYYQSANEKGNAVAVLNGIGEVYALEQHYPESMNTLTQALASVKGVDDPLLTARIMLNAGLTYRALGQPNEALRYLRDAANTLRTNRAGRDFEVLILFHIGSVYFDNAQFQDAKRYYGEAAGIAKSVGDSIAENYLGVFQIRADESMISPAERRLRVESLLKAFQPVVQAFQNIGHRTGEAYVDAQMGRLYQSVGNLMKAREMFQKAVALEESDVGEYVDQQLHAPYLKKLNMKEERSEWYSLLAGVLVQLKNPEEALWYLDKACLKQYYDVFKTAEVEVRNPTVKEEFEATRERMRHLRILDIELSRLLSGQSSGKQEEIQKRRDEIAQLKRQVAESSARMVAAQPNYEPLLRVGAARISEIQNLIPRGTVIVRFLPTSSQLYIFAVTRSRVEVRTSTVPRDVLLASLAEYRRLLQDPGVYTGVGGEASIPVMTRFGTLSPQLYEYLLRPVESLFERNLVIIPSREFENFPFHAIERQERNNTVKYVVELTSVDYLPSLTSLKYKTTASLKFNRIVAIGNPSGKNWSIDYELRDIRSFFKEASVLTALEASWDNLKAAQGEVLQLATDFVYEGTTAPLGLLALSDGRTAEESIKIPFERLAGLKPYPVIVLSNQYGQGTALASAHALLLRINGTPDVFFNAWFADRKAAKFFSEYFFTHLSNGLAPGDAYRQALLNLIQTKDVNHPHSWGQFFHFGVG